MESQEADHARPRNLVLCSDGTGNRGGKTRGTNVWRISQAVDTNSNEVEQLVFYDDGVGTEDFKLFKLLTGALGLGLSRNICQLYQWLVLNYRSGDRIFLFGFSRGAFTVRSLAGMIECCGLVDVSVLRASGIGLMVKKAYACYRSGGSMTGCIPAPKIQFLGVWDTVGAVGGPPWLRHGRWSPVRRLTSHHNIHANNWLRACQALAIDDERRSFWPELLEPQENGAVSQVWFAGAHSNVGGGYPKDGIAFVTLQWMMSHAHNRQLRFTDESWAETRHRANAHDRIYDSRSGLAAFYRYSPRVPLKVAKEFGERFPERMCAPANVYHETVLERIQRSTSSYAPVLLFEQPNGTRVEVAASPRVGGGSYLDAAAENGGGDGNERSKEHLRRASFADLDQDSIRRDLEEAKGPIGKQILLYWILLLGTFTSLGAGIWIPLKIDAVEPVWPFTWIFWILTFPIPFDVFDDFVEGLAGVASRDPLVSGVVVILFVAAISALFVWRQKLRSEVTRRGLDAWQVLREREEPPASAATK